MEQGLVTDIAISIIAAWVVAVLSQVARQPLLLAYLVAGFAIGPHGFQWITNTQSTDIAISIIAAWVVAVASQVARQPLLLAYLVAGFAIGPHGFQWITDTHSIATISDIGLSLLLFMIGLEIDLKKMVSAGRVITLTAAAQILGCVLLGWIVFGLIGPAENRLEALYLGVAAAMRSTGIIVDR